MGGLSKPIVALALCLSIVPATGCKHDDAEEGSAGSAKIGKRDKKAAKKQVKEEDGNRIEEWRERYEEIDEKYGVEERYEEIREKIEEDETYREMKEKLEEDERYQKIREKIRDHLERREDDGG